MLPGDCVAAGGVPQGAGTQCATHQCPDGDFDQDGDVDLIDFTEFQICFGGATLIPPCNLGDFDANQMIDLLDYGRFESRLTGPSDCLQ